MARGLDDRERDENGRIREKNSNTLVDTLRETYGDGFGGKIRSDAKLRTVLDRAGATSLSEYLRRKRR